MLGLDMLDVAIGVVFVFLLVSLIASAIAEYIESLLKKRSSDLEKGILEMLRGDKKLLQQVYEHPIILSLYECGSHEEAKKANKLPSYIPARSFALAMMDLFMSTDKRSGAAGATPPDAPVSQSVAGAVAADSANQIVQNAAKIEGVADSIVTKLRDVATKAQSDATERLGPEARLASLPADVARVLVTAIDAANGDASKVRANLEGWFNSSMDRVSGWYKRRSHLILVGTGLLLAIAFNIDTIAIVQSLWTNRGMREAAVAAASAFAQQQAHVEQTVTDTTGTRAVTDTTSTQLPAGATATQTAPQPTETTGSQTTTAATPTETVTETTASQTATGTTASQTATDTTASAPATDTEKARADAKMKADAEAQEAMRQKIKTYTSSLNALQLPIGWASVNCPGLKDDATIVDRFKSKDWWCCWLLSIPLHLIGWIITAAAVSMGAPFWFDTLNRIMVVRSTIKPHEKSAEEAPKERTSAVT
jgi:hypothetical protein